MVLFSIAFRSLPLRLGFLSFKSKGFECRGRSVYRESANPPVRQSANVCVTCQWASHCSLCSKMTLNDFLLLTMSFPEALNHEILLKILSFLFYVPWFKNDILLAQSSSWSASDPPMFLPQSVVILLSYLCDTDEKSTNGLWSYLKDAMWGYAEKARVIDSDRHG